MIVFRNNTGQLGNQLFEFGSFIANSLKNNSILINFHFDKYKMHFKKCSQNTQLIKVTTGSDFGDKIIKKVTSKLRSTPVLTGNGNPKDFSKVNSMGKFMVKKGAWFINYDDFYNYKEDIKSYFEPLDQYQENINRLIESCRKSCDILVGIHIRGGDYNNFLGGKLYFEPNIYADKMMQIKSLFPDKKVGFLICSNDVIPVEYFHGLLVFKGTNQFIEDMYSFSKCDYLLGPPSTYTMWASFYGNVPLQKLRTFDQKIEIKGFEIDYGY